MSQTLIKPEIIHDLPETEYHSQTGLGDGLYVTRSMLGCWLDDPALFKLRYVDKNPIAQVKPAEAMEFGNVFESLLLDDPSPYVCEPDFCENAKGEQVTWNYRQSQKVIGSDMTTTEWRDSQAHVMTREDYDKAQFLINRFNDTALGKWWLDKRSQSRNQLTIRWRDEVTGLPLQVRIDNEAEGTFLCDVKTSSKSLERFADTAHNYHYALQQAMYSDGYTLATGNKLPYVFAVAETSGLMRSRILSLPPLQIQWAEAEYRRALKGIAEENYTPRDAALTTPIECELKPWLLYEYEGEQ